MSSIGLQLKSLGYNLSIDFMYDPTSSADAGFGIGRNCSANAYVVSNTDIGLAQVMRGDGSQSVYYPVGASGGITTYSVSTLSYSPNTLIYDGTYFRETSASG